MKYIITLVLLICVVFPIYAYEPLTEEQADAFLDSVTYEEVIDIVIEYDYLEHTVPKVMFPTTEYLLIGTDLLITPMDDLSIFHGRFSYDIPMEQKTVYNFVDEKKPDILGKSLTFVVGTGIGVLLGFFIGSVL